LPETFAKIGLKKYKVQSLASKVLSFTVKQVLGYNNFIALNRINTRTEQRQNNSKKTNVTP